MRAFSVKDVPPPVAIPEVLKSLKVLGLGIAGLDFIANVDHFPQPDEKMRSTDFFVFGGGNCGNTLTCVRRLGIPCAMACKLGQDSNGDAITKELNQDGIDTEFCIRKPLLNSPFSYIIVDSTSQTRTCIHTPIEEELLPEEVTRAWLDGISLVHLDSRFTQAAVQVAKYANEKGIPVVLDVEKERPFIRDLIPLAEVIITNDAFPSIFLPGEEKLKGMKALLEQGVCRMVISTEGSKGSVLLRRKGEEKGGERKGVPEGLVSSEDVDIDGCAFEVVRCKAWPVDKVVDTTGAGDAYIGGVIYGLVTSLPTVQCMALGARVAASKLQKAGAREGLPRREDVEGHLLSATATQSG